MDKREVAAYFNSCAPQWEQNQQVDRERIERILDNGEIGPGMDILDVACGTGVLFPYYLEREAASITGVDISPEMLKEAEAKFGADPRVHLICADAENLELEQRFDRIVVYNALPHFPNPKHLIKRLAGLLKEGGRLTIAHGASREQINQCHVGLSSEVCMDLMPADSLKKLFDPYFDVEVMISNSRMYQLSGVKRDPLADVHCGIPHSHGGLTHSHSHGEVTHEHIPDKDATPMQELLVLMRYLVSHNDAHAQEVADLAKELQMAGKDVAYDEIMDAVSDFDMVNAKLDAILSQLTEEEVF